MRIQLGDVVENSIVPTIVVEPVNMLQSAILHFFVLSYADNPLSRAPSIDIAFLPLLLLLGFKTVFKRAKEEIIELIMCNVFLMINFLGINKCEKGVIKEIVRYTIRKIRSGRWSAQARNVGSQCWLSILDRWSIETWMIIAGLYWLVILAPKSLPMIGRESLPELSRRSIKFIMILIMTIKFKTYRIINTY